MRIVVIGESGQLARSLASAGTDIQIECLGRDKLDFASPDSIAPALTAAAPDIIINAAAYTAVDNAEDDRELAFAVNAKGPGIAAEVAAELDVPFLHISTDYVFDGTKKGRYDEFDPVAPIGVYGKSKEAGEQAVRAASPKHAIYRTAWVHSPYGNNFVKTMLRLAADRDELRVVGDQRGSPTSAVDLAHFLLRAAQFCIAEEDGAFGTFHVAGMGEASWAEFAETIADRGAALGLISRAPTVRHITTAEFPTKAKRPANSVLDCRKSQAVYGFTMKPWQAALDDVLRTLAAAS